MDDKERKMFEQKIKELRDVIAAQDKLIQEMQDLVEILRKAQA